MENLQLGRLDDCIQHYSVLHSNLVSIANELDNIPTDEHDAYEHIDVFPDEIMRRDVLEELQPFEDRALPRPPLIPPCDQCARQNFTSEYCRLRLRHVEPSSKLSPNEQLEMIRAAQVMLARQRQRCKNMTETKKKRNYLRWSADDQFTVQIAMKVFGASNYNMISSVFCNRSVSQVSINNKNVLWISSITNLPLLDIAGPTLHWQDESSRS